jgi:hypothetical protein
LYDNLLEYMFYFEFYMPMTSQRCVTVDGALADLDCGFSLANAEQVLILAIRKKIRQPKGSIWNGINLYSGLS